MRRSTVNLPRSALRMREKSAAANRRPALRRAHGEVLPVERLDDFGGKDGLELLDVSVLVTKIGKRFPLPRTSLPFIATARSDDRVTQSPSLGVSATAEQGALPLHFLFNSIPVPLADEAHDVAWLVHDHRKQAGDVTSEDAGVESLELRDGGELTAKQYLVPAITGEPDLRFNGD